MQILTKLQAFLAFIGTTFVFLLVYHVYNPNYFKRLSHAFLKTMNSDMSGNLSYSLNTEAKTQNFLTTTTSTVTNDTHITPTSKGWWKESRILYLQGHRGRLGNHMFQYAAAYGVAKRTNSKVVMSTKHQLPRYFQHLTFPFTGHDNKYGKSWPVARETQPSKFTQELFDDIPKAKEVLLCCFLESFRYFEGYESEIRTEFRFKEQIDKNAIEFIGKARSLAEDMYKSKQVTLVGIHIRRGDKAGKPGFGWLVPEKSYFQKAMKYMTEHYKNVYYVVTSEDYNWSKKALGNNGIIYSSKKISPGQDLAYLTKCDHVIMSVGTMGWWAGWLAGGEVIYFDKPTRSGSTADKICNLWDLFPNLTNWVPMSN